MIVVTGTTGVIGGEVARQLIAAGQTPRLVARDRMKAGALFDADAVEVVEADLSRPETLLPAFAGATKLFLMSAGLDGPALEKNAIAAAQKAGIKHVVKLSAIGAGVDAPFFAFAKWHSVSERALIESGLSWTMLRPGSFMTNTLRWAPTIRSNDLFSGATGEGRLAMIDPSDIARVAVKALTDAGHGHESKAYTMTGPEALTAAEQADILGSVLGRRIRYVDVSPEDMESELLRSGLPAGVVAARLDMMAAIKAGKVADVVVPTDLLGREGSRFVDWAKRNVAAFR